MDNFRIELCAEGQVTLARAIEIAFQHNAPGNKAEFYRVVKLRRKTTYYGMECKVEDGNLDVGDKPFRVSHSSEWAEHRDGTPTLILLWSHEQAPGVMPLAFKMTPAHAIPFVKGWLENAADPGQQPDHDGSNGRGFYVFTEGWGHVAGMHYAIVGVQATWAMYGK